MAVVELYQEAVDKVSRYKYGYIGSLANMQATIAHDSVVKGPCQYAFMRKPLEKVNYALAFKKGTNYPVIFDKWSVNSPRHNASSFSSFKAFSYAQQKK